MKKKSRPQLAKVLGKRLAQYRKNARLTQEKVAEIVEVEPLTISRYETGVYLPSVLVLQSLSRLYGVDMAVMLDENAKIGLNNDAEWFARRVSGLGLTERTWLLGVIDNLLEAPALRTR